MVARGKREARRPGFRRPPRNPSPERADVSPLFGTGVRRPNSDCRNRIQRQAAKPPRRKGPGSPSLPRVLASWRLGVEPIQPIYPGLRGGWRCKLRRLSRPSRQLVDSGAKAWWGNGSTRGLGRLDPSGLGFQHFGKRLLGGFPKGVTVREVGNVRNIPAVLFAVEDVDVVVLHSGLPKDRLYRSMRRSNCRTW
jgi:hypothetical protein